MPDKANLTGGGLLPERPGDPNSPKSDNEKEKCSLAKVIGLVMIAVAMLAAACLLANYWPAAFPLFIAAGIVSGVTFGVIPEILKALDEYVACRGPSNICSISPTINTLGKVGTVLSMIGFAVAGGLQIGAIAAFASIFLAWLGLIIEEVVIGLVTVGIIGCIASMVLLAGVLTNAYAYKSCMDRLGQSL